MKKALSLCLLCVLFCTLSLSILTSCGGARIVFDYQDDLTPKLSITDPATLPTDTPVREGYHFLGWQDRSGTTYTVEELRTLLTAGQSCKVRAVWEAHAFGQTHTVEANCAEGAHTVRVCSHCSFVEKTYDPQKPALSHSFGESQSHAATCLVGAYRSVTCAHCGYEERTYYDNHPALGHTWVDATYSTPKHCSVCQHSEGLPLEYVFYHNLPTVRLTTNNGVLPTDKETYSAGTFTMTDADPFNVPRSSCGIRLRGNYSASPDKKPYRIRFDEKTSLFGRPANRSWVLLADYLDVSHIKNFAIYNFANLLDGQDFKLLTRHVSVYFNGQWLGIYMLTDQVNENEGRADIEEDLAALAKKGPEVPFLIELDDYAWQDGAEGVAYFTYVVPASKSYDNKKLTLKFSIKYPDETERVTPQQYQYIRDYTYAALNAVFGLNGENWRDYWDEDSLIDYFIANQWGSNGEISWKSVFLYKPYGEKMYSGPVWDFDWGVGGPNWVTPGTQWETFCNPDLGRGGPGYRGNAKSWRRNAWFTYLWKNDPQFVVNFYDRWQVARKCAQRILDELALYKPIIAGEIDREMQVWGRCQTPEYLNHPYGKASGQYEVVCEILQEQITFIDNTIKNAYNVAKVQLALQNRK